MKRFFVALLLTLALCALFAAPAAAAQPSFSCEVTRTVNGAEVSDLTGLAAGTPVTVTVTMTRDDLASGSYECWGLELDIKSLGLEYVSGSGFSYVYDGQTRTAGPSGFSVGGATGTGTLRFFYITMSADDAFTVNKTVSVSATYTVTDPGKAQAWTTEPRVYLTGSYDPEVVEYTCALKLNAAGGSISGADPSGSYAVDKVVALPSASRSGYVFMGWSDGVTTYAGGSSYTVTTDRTLSAVWGYTVSFDAGEGTLSSSASPTVTVAVGDSITLPRATLSGYTLDGWSDGSATYAAAAAYTPKGNVTLTAQWISTIPQIIIPDDPVSTAFSDVAASAYYAQAVSWAVQQGVTQGLTAASFGPDITCTRAQAVTFIWRAVGSPEPAAAANRFTDVSPSDYFYKAVQWAVQQGVTEGVSATAFAPNATCTRAQIVTFLWRSQGRPSAAASSAFTDVAASAYYAQAVSWAVKNNITAGMTASTFAPDAYCTRAQIVTFLYRCLGK